MEQKVFEEIMTRNMLKWLNLSDYTFKKSSKSHEETCKENPFPKKQNKTKKILKTDKKKKILCLQRRNSWTKKDVTAETIDMEHKK